MALMEGNQESKFVGNGEDHYVNSMKGSFPVPFTNESQTTDCLEHSGNSKSNCPAGRNLVSVVEMI
jgi:hypothetical protein